MAEQSGERRLELSGEKVSLWSLIFEKKEKDYLTKKKVEGEKMKKILFLLMLIPMIGMGAPNGYFSWDRATDTFTMIADVAQVDAFQLNITNATDHSAGQLSYDPTSKTILADTGYADVRVNIGQETHIRFFNDTGSTITNGYVVNAAGVDGVNDVVKGVLADASSAQLSSAVIGIATHDVPDQTVGLATLIGEVRGIDTSGLPEGGVVYLSATAGELTTTRPTYPDTIVIAGTVIKSDADGIFLSQITTFDRRNGGKSYSFRSAAGASGINYVGGFYKAPATDTTLTQASLTQTYGAANVAYAAHAFAVFGGAGTVDAGQVGLRVTGNSINDTGTLTLGDTETLTTNITEVALNQYIETSKKWVGTVTNELYEIAAAGTYTVDFNYGLAKYEDLGNNDFTITDIEAVGVAGANDTGFNIRLLQHKIAGWTYSASAFVPGDGAIASWSTDMSPYDNLASADSFAWKRDNLSTFIDGGGSEGLIVEITTTANNAVRSMDVHIGAQLEELVEQ
jgi:hypothetical protein